MKGKGREGKGREGKEREGIGRAGGWCPPDDFFARRP